MFSGPCPALLVDLPYVDSADECTRVLATCALQHHDVLDGYVLRHTPLIGICCHMQALLLMFECMDYGRTCSQRNAVSLALMWRVIQGQHEPALLIRVQQYMVF